MPTNKKGIIFAADALVAVIVLAAFVATISFLAAKSSEGSYSKLLLSKQGEDSLLAMDKAGILQSGNLTLIRKALNTTLGPDASYEITLEIYNQSAGGIFFANASNSSKGNLAKAKQVSASQRQYVTIRGGQPSNFGIATLKVWME